MRTSRHLRRWLITSAIVLIAVVVGGPYIYIHFVEGKAPAKLSVATGAQSSAAADVALDGGWKVGPGSQAGYRVKEVLFGQNNEAVGRTTAVTGQITIAGSKVPDGSFTVDMTKVSSDQSRRDGQFHGRIMNTSTFPTATFKLTQPIDFGTAPSGAEPVKATATGDLTLKGVTRSVSFDVTGKRSGSGIAVSGSIPVTFADFNIGNPSFGGVSTEDHGVVEFLLTFAKA